MSKPTMIITDIYDMMTGKDAYTQWKENNATDMIMSGNFLDANGQSVYAIILLSSKVPEEVAQRVLNDAYTTIIRPKGYRKYVMAWIPMNDLNEMVVCDCEKDTDGFRIGVISTLMETTKAFQIMREFPGCADVADVLYKKAMA